MVFIQVHAFDQCHARTVTGSCSRPGNNRCFIVRLLLAPAAYNGFQTAGMLIPRHIIGPKYGNRVTVKQIARYLTGELAVPAGCHNCRLKIRYDGSRIFKQVQGTQPSLVRSWHSHLTSYGLNMMPWDCSRTYCVLYCSQDGVLLRGKNILPAAKEALSILDGNNKLGLYLCLPYLSSS